LYQVLPFEFQFKCSGDALRGFLNSLTKADLFFAVRRCRSPVKRPTTEKTPRGREPLRNARRCGNSNDPETHAVVRDRAH
jgi:hypothetical protein